MSRVTTLPGTDDAAVADHNAAADGDITGKPAVAADAYRLCVLQIVCAAVRPCEDIALGAEK